MSNVIYCLKWNFEFDLPLSQIKDIKTLEKGKRYYRAYFEDLHQVKRPIRLDHLIKNRFKDSLIECFSYFYEEGVLQRRDCLNRKTNSKWYNDYLYNDLQELERIDVYSSNHGSKDFSLISYSLFFYDSHKRKTLRKILRPDGELSGYEVFHYEDDRLTKMEMFDRDNNKLFSEIYHHLNDGSLKQIDYFDSEGHYERSLATGL